MTINKDQTGSILPVVVVVGLIMCAGYFLLRDDLKIPNLFNRTPQIERVEGFPKRVFVTSEKERIKKVIKSEAELAQFLNEVDENNQISFSNKINFDKKYVLAASSKTMPNDKYKFKIEKLYKDDKSKTLSVNVTTTEAENCVGEIAGDPNISIDLAIIDKTDWNITFESVKKTMPCD